MPQIHSFEHDFLILSVRAAEQKAKVTLADRCLYAGNKGLV